MDTVTALHNPRTDGYWEDLGKCDHAVQIYGDETTFMDALEGFVASGLRKGESVILISTASHMHELEKRLRASWIDIDRARWEDRYIAVLANETLKKFMVRDEPDEALFTQAAADLLKRARGSGGDRKVRAFGEMVAILWAERHAGAAIKLENLWNKLQAVEHFPLFCAYPRLGFANDASAAIRQVCATHSRVVPGYR
jgi:DcmR-like sensory protein